jgi:hypothetical protein
VFGLFCFHAFAQPLYPEPPAVKFSYRLDASRQFFPFSKQQLLGMHALIDAQKIDVAKSQSVFKQIEALESTTGNHAYTQSLRRYGMECRLPFALGLLFMLAAIASGIATLAVAEGWQVPLPSALPYDTQTLLHGLSAVTAGLFVAFLLAHFYVRARAATLMGKGLSRWWALTLQRWIPDLVTRHDVAHLPPETVAQLVAVQGRIQDVDLDLKPSADEAPAKATN